MSGPLRRVATRKRSSGPYSREVDKRARSDDVTNQSLMTVSQRCDVTDQSLVTVSQRCDDVDELGAGFRCQGSSQWDKPTQSSPGTTPTKIYSQHRNIPNIPNKRPLFRPLKKTNVIHTQSPLTSSGLVTATQRDDEGGWIESTRHPQGDPNPTGGFTDDIEEWAEDEFRADDDLFSITSTPSTSSHVEVIQPETVCNNLSPVVNKHLHQKNIAGTVQLDNYRVNSVTGTTDTRCVAKETEDDWDGEDSLFEKIDLSRIVAESQKLGKRDGLQNDVAQTAGSRGGCQQANDEPDNVGIHLRGETGSVSISNLNKNVDVEFDVNNRNSNPLNKCSVSETTVAIGNSGKSSSGHRGETRNDNVQSVSGAQSSTSVTPAQEKWFSHIGQYEDNSSMHAGTSERTPKQLASNTNLNARNTEAMAPSTSRSTVSNTGNSTMQRTAPHAKSLTPNHSSKGVSRQPCETPQTSIANRLKQRLHNNAKVVTPVQNRAAQLRKASIDVAMSEAMEVQNRVMDKDVGPFYGLPSKVQELLKGHRGIDQLYDWQHSCLTLPAIQEGHNLIYSLPTSGGKTLVAEILIMQQLLGHKKDAILVVPYVAIVQEKVTNLSVFAVELGFLVEEYAGSKGAIPPRKRRKKRTLYIATIEKAHSLVNSLIQEQRIADVGLVVVDELHMLGDGRRGATLEMCLSKLIYTNTAQVIGMSATLSNIQDLCAFMKAELYTSDFRPVELREYVKVEDNIFEVKPGSGLGPDEKFVHARTVTFPYSKGLLKTDPDHLIGLALEVIPDFSCLIFCATKKNCQNVAEIICKHMPREFAKKIMAHKTKEKKELLLSLRRECDNHLCPTLKKTVPYGLAYHHSGLTMDERKLVEDAYSEGTLCMLTCTSTLAAGVNLPAKRVILRSPYIAKDLLTSSRYKQMVGRAGRAGIDTSGESIMIIKPQEKPQVTDMLSGPLEGCYSSLMHDDGKGLRGLVLTLVALKITKDRQSLVDFMQLTLLGVQTQESEEDLAELTHIALQQIIELKLVKEKQDDDGKMVLEVTKLGHAAFKGSIDIDLCSTVYKDLKFACDQGLVLANALHLLYLVTPYDQVENTQPNWIIYDRQHSRLGECERKVSDMIGVTELYLSCKITGKRVRADDDTHFRVQRFYLTLILWSLLNQKSIWDVSSRFEVPRGFIQNLFSSAASFASSVQRFCEDLPEFWAFQQLLAKVVYDLTYLATPDLVALLEIPGVKQGRAKQLVKAGYKTLRHLAHADINTLVQEVEHMPRKMALQIVSAAKMELSERAEALREEAEEMASKPMLNTTQ
ncbi:helicase POLQ-like [Amphiura filiformis]|uniref:helicase POLQ-like n=1 Tax=Amphiura filiformis TaxID=82378 RepID=UPI003B20C6F3